MEITHAKDKDILSKILTENGRVPNPLKLIEERPGTVEKFLAYSKTAQE